MASGTRSKDVTSKGNQQQQQLFDKLHNFLISCTDEQPKVHDEPKVHASDVEELNTMSRDQLVSLVIAMKEEV